MRRRNPTRVTLERPRQINTLTHPPLTLPLRPPPRPQIKHRQPQQKEPHTRHERPDRREDDTARRPVARRQFHKAPNDAGDGENLGAFRVAEGVAPAGIERGVEDRQARRAQEIAERDSNQATGGRPEEDEDGRGREQEGAPRRHPRARAPRGMVRPGPGSGSWRHRRRRGGRDQGMGVNIVLGLNIPPGDGKIRRQQQPKDGKR